MVLCCAEEAAGGGGGGGMQEEKQKKHMAMWGTIVWTKPIHRIVAYSHDISM